MFFHILGIMVTCVTVHTLIFGAPPAALTLFGYGLAYNVYVHKGEDISNFIRQLLRDALDENSVTGHSASQVRGFFLDHPIPRPLISKTTDHPQAAADRAAASNFCDLFIKSIGCTPYFVQMSKSDQRKGRIGSRTRYWAKDIQCTPCNASLEPNMMPVMIDVDYYVDMPKYLAGLNRSMILYTQVPEVAGGFKDGVAHSFDETGRLVSRVLGGAEYRHKLWDYNVDVFTTHRWGTWWEQLFKGEFFLTSSYVVQRKRVAEGRMLILLGHIGTWTNISAVVANWLHASRLKRFNPVDNGFVRINSLSDRGPTTSIARIDSILAATVDERDFDAARAAMRCITHNMSRAEVESHLSGPEAKREATVITDYLRSAVETAAAYVYPIDRSVNYFTSVKALGEHLKPTMLPFMSPIIMANFVPLASKINEQVAVEERVLKLKTNVVLTQSLSNHIQEFIELLVPTQSVLNPTELQEVYERQARPTQRSLLARADGMISRTWSRTVSFLKAEAYEELKDQRVIHTIPAVDKRDYALFAYPAMNYVKTLRWYAFGKYPLEVAERVAEVARDAEYVVETDLSRQDGRHSNAPRYLEQQFFLRLYDRKFHPIILEVMNKHHHKNGTTLRGFTYETEWQRLSGEIATSLGNTISAAFVAYRAYRKNGLSPKDAFDSIGLHGGDDGIAANVPAKLLMQSASEFGYLMKAKTVKRGSVGLSFLARIYGPHVWTGDLNSMTDPRRALAKFHLTPIRQGLDKHVKLIEKCRSLWLSDAKTPVLGAFVTAVLEDSDDQFEFDPLVDPYRLRKWANLVPKDKQYPNIGRAWMYAYLRAQCPGIQIKEFNKWLATKPDWFRPPLIWTSPTPKENSKYKSTDVRPEKTYQRGKGPSKPNKLKDKPNVDPTAFGESKN